jgi:hypothetical protein
LFAWNIALFSPDRQWPQLPDRLGDQVAFTLHGVTSWLDLDPNIITVVIAATE